MKVLTTFYVVISDNQVASVMLVKIILILVDISQIVCDFSDVGKSRDPGSIKRVKYVNEKPLRESTKVRN